MAFFAVLQLHNGSVSRVVAVANALGIEAISDGNHLGRNALEVVGVQCLSAAGDDHRIAGDGTCLMGQLGFIHLRQGRRTAGTLVPLAVLLFKGGMGIKGFLTGREALGRESGITEGAPSCWPIIMNIMPKSPSNLGTFRVTSSVTLVGVT